MAKGVPILPNIEVLIAAGINPKTGLPYKCTDSDYNLKPEIKKVLRILDEQDAVNRYKWKNIPADLTSQELERLLYYKGSLCLFYHPDIKQFYVMPYALNGTIDVYGRFLHIKPVPLSNAVDENEDTNIKVLFTSLKLKVIRKPILSPKKEDMLYSAVILNDYTNQISQNLIPRANLQDAVIDVESECIPYLRTCLQIASGVKPCRVTDADQQEAMKQASKAIKNAALSGEALIPFIGDIETQELFDGTAGKAEEFMMSMQSLDNFRLKCLGIESGGVFEKKAHTLGSEQEMNKNASSNPIKDGLAIRKNFCNIVNSIWKCGIDVEIDQEEQSNQEEQLGGGEDVDNNDTEVQQ